MQLGLPHPLMQASFDMCAHIPLTLWVSIFYVMLMVMNTLEPMMQFTTPLSPLHKMLVSMWNKNNYMCFLQPHSTLRVDKSTLCLLKMTFTSYSTLSLPTQCEWIYFFDLAHFKDLSPPMQIKSKKKAIVIDIPLINSSFSN
jgi:hypothetical protein